MDIFIPANVRDVMNRLESAGYEAFVVGGCVRDSLMGRKPKDYDIATSAGPEQIIESMGGSFKIIETGIKHGTVTVVSGGENIEVTTYRTDGEYINHRSPESVKFTSNLADDLSRRDFTVNAMAYSDKAGIIDKFGGQKDLFNRRIRCVGSAEKRFEEDALRIMRALRLASELNFRIDIDTASAIHAKKQLLREISVERISSELTGFLTGVSPCDLMIEFDDVFCTVIPEFAKCVGFDQHSRYHIYDVWEHTAHALDVAKEDKDIRIALLFHDIEKPSCFKLDEEGQGHFPGHEKKSAETAANILRRMHFDNETIRNVSELIKFHYITPIDDKRVVKRLISVLGLEMFIKLTEVMKSDSRAKQSFCLERVNTLDTMKFRAYEIVNDGECYSLNSLEIKGSDLEQLGFVGKNIGEALNTLLNMVIDEKLPNDRNVLIEAARDFSFSFKKGN